MIRDSKSISMMEATEYLGKPENAEVEELKAFIKKFAVLGIKKAKELRKKIEALDLMKVKEEHISKIIELMPEDAGDLNKIFVDISLDEDETKKILEAIKEVR